MLSLSSDQLELYHLKASCVLPGSQWTASVVHRGLQSAVPAVPVWSCSETPIGANILPPKAKAHMILITSYSYESKSLPAKQKL